MCLAVPRKIIAIKNKTARLQDERMVKLDLVPSAKVGDYVIVSADLAVEIISEKDAVEMEKLLRDAV
jgi:hydrogenase expression/formation protein HypC